MLTITEKKIEATSRKIPFRGLSISTMRNPSIVRVLLILALKTFNHYIVENINHTPEETYGA